MIIGAGTPVNGPVGIVIVGPIGQETVSELDVAPVMTVAVTGVATGAVALTVALVAAFAFVCTTGFFTRADDWAKLTWPVYAKSKIRI